MIAARRAAQTSFSFLQLRQIVIFLAATKAGPTRERISGRTPGHGERLHLAADDAQDGAQLSDFYKVAQHGAALNPIAVVKDFSGLEMVRHGSPTPHGRGSVLLFSRLALGKHLPV